MVDRRAVLITRPEPDASATAALVAARGFAPVVAPVMTLRQRTVSGRGRFDAVLATSRNAIPSLPDALKRLPLLAVGSATAARARDAGFATVHDADGDAVALAALTRRTLPPGSRLLFAHGVGQGDALAWALTGSGFRVTRRRAYAASGLRRLPGAARVALEREALRSAMFLSADTARVFVRLLPEGLLPFLAAVDAVAIGPVAADVLAPLPWRRVRVSLRPTLDEVLTQI